MKRTASLLLLLIGCIAGCDSARSVLCIAPRESFNPHSESELLVELNAHLPFTITPKQFIARQKSGGMVGWAVVQNDRQKDAVKDGLKHSATLTLLQVEALTPEFEAILKQHNE